MKLIQGHASRTAVAGFASLWRDVRAAGSRRSFSLSASGACGAAVVAERGRAVLERWSLDETQISCTRGPVLDLDLEAVRAGTAPVDLLPDDDGSVLICHGDGRRQTVRRVGSGIDGESEVIGVVGDPQAAMLAPIGSGGHVVVCSRATTGEATLWVLGDSEQELCSVAKLPGLLRPESADFPGWGLVDGRTFAATVPLHGVPRVMLVDLATGRVSVGTSLCPGGEQVIATAPNAGLLLVVASPGGEPTLFLVDKTGSESPRPLDFGDLGGAVTPLAFDPPGKRMLLRAQHGLRGRLLVADLATGQAAPLAAPGGTVGGPAVWAHCGDRERITCVLVDSDPPFQVLRVDPSSPAEPQTVTDGTDLSRRGRWAPAWPESFPAAEGEIEALVTGREPWREADQVVVALHGGPERAWSSGLHPLMQALAHAGVTVIAPNQRGSTGYGKSHQRAIHGRWGGPDLDDVIALARHVRAGREHGDDRLLLYGESYGAWLALLAAACAPQLWSRAAVLAPFLSGPRLHRDGSRPVRQLLERLGGLDDIDDDIGPRDLLRLAHRIEASVLVVHGSEDDVVPVGHSRTLADHVVQSGRAEPGQFAYVEAPGRGHAALDGSEHLTGAVLAHLAGGTVPAVDVEIFPFPRSKRGWGEASDEDAGGERLACAPT